MKYPKIAIQIPEPCHEDWYQMSATEKGKFCQVCTKEVIDFSAQSDEEIIKHFSNYENVCGRFNASQLNRKLIADRKKRNHWLSYAASLLLPMTLFSQEKQQKNEKPDKVEQTDSLQFKSLAIGSLQRKAQKKVSIQKDSITITGTVTDDLGIPLPAANVSIKGTNIGVVTDFDGKYTLKVNSNDRIEISYIGFDNKIIKIDKAKKQYDVVLESSVMGDIVTVVGGAIGTPVSCYAGEYYTKYMTPEEIKERDQRTENYFTFQRKKWLEKREQRRAKRAERKAARAKKRQEKESN